MLYTMTDTVHGVLISPFCRILSLPVGRVTEARALDGTRYIRTLGSSPDTVTVLAVLNGDEQKAALENAYRTGAEVLISSENGGEARERTAVIAEITYTERKFSGIRQAEIKLWETEAS